MKINFTKLFLFIILLSFGFLHAQVSGNQDSSDNSGQELNALSPIDVIAESIKDYVSVYSDEEFVDLVKYQFYKIHMMDESGMWITEEFAQISDTLLPADISIADAYDLIDQIAANMKKNPFFVGFINAAFEKEFAVLFNKIETEGEAVIPEAVAWALALENIIKAQLNDPAFLDYAVQYWIGEREKSGVTFADMGLFGAIKLKSVEIPLQNLLEIHRSKEMDPKLLRGWLPTNISEAIIADMVQGYWANAYAGIPLAHNKPGEPVNEELGTGPSTFTEDGKRMEFRYALPLMWDDLYQVWNLAFCAQIPNYPYWFAKLLIPSVSGYQDIPEEYIYRRALALYTSEQYIFLGDQVSEEAGIAPIDWSDKELTRMWGSFNKKYADEYRRAVRKIRWGW